MYLLECKETQNIDSHRTNFNTHPETQLCKCNTLSRRETLHPTNNISSSRKSSLIQLIRAPSLETHHRQLQPDTLHILHHIWLAFSNANPLLH